MLTLKHVHTDGSEHIFEAESVKVIRNVDHFSDGIFLDWRDNGNGAFNWKHVIHFAQSRSADDTNPIVYVMNGEGSTVARYPL